MTLGSGPDEDEAERIADKKIGKDKWDVMYDDPAKRYRKRSKERRKEEKRERELREAFEVGDMSYSGGSDILQDRVNGFVHASVFCIECVCGMCLVLFTISLASVFLAGFPVGFDSAPYSRWESLRAWGGLIAFFLFVAYIERVLQSRDGHDTVNLALRALWFVTVGWALGLLLFPIGIGLMLTVIGFPVGAYLCAKTWAVMTLKTNPETVVVERPETAG